MMTKFDSKIATIFKYLLLNKSILKQDLTNSAEFNDRLFYLAEANKLLPQISEQVKQKKFQEYNKARLVFNLKYLFVRTKIVKLMEESNIEFVFLKELNNFESVHESGHESSHASSNASTHGGKYEGKYVGTFENIIKGVSEDVQNSTFYGSDIDLIVDLKNLSHATKLLINQGFILKNRPPQEFTFLHPGFKIEIDLHFLIAIPRYHAFEKKDLLHLTKDAFLFSSRKEICEHRFSDEFVLITSIYRFWANDFLRGLRSLFDIYQFYIQKKSSLDWDFIWNYVHHHKNGVIVSFTLLLGLKIFDEKIYNKLKANMDFRKKIAFKYFSLQRLTVFPGKKNWWDASDAITSQLIKENHFIRLLIDDKESWTRLIRPKIIYFIVKMIFYDEKKWQ